MHSLPPLLAFGAHPDDIEFACGAIIAQESANGRKCHFIITSRGEAASNGTPAQRTREAQNSAKILGASLEFLKLDGDARLKPRTDHALTLAALIRQHKPAILLAPSTVENQHPDHAALGKLVRTAARLARYGGLKDKKLKNLPPHTIDLLLYYALSPDAEPKDIPPILIEISPSALAAWTQAMKAHASQMKTRNYLDLQLARARLHGLRAGAGGGHAIPLFPNDPLLFNSITQLTRSARSF